MLPAVETETTKPKSLDQEAARLKENEREKGKRIEETKGK